MRPDHDIQEAELRLNEHSRLGASVLVHRRPGSALRGS